MHDIDRTLAELTMETDAFETDAFEFEFDNEYYGETDTESPFSEVEEMELASELLEITDEAELDQFLGKLIKRVGRGVGKFVKSPVGKALGGVLKSAAKSALPIAGSALGGFFGGPIGASIGGKLASAATNLFEMEVAGMSQEDQEFEVARRFVKFAGATTKNALSSPRPSPAAVTSAVQAAAKRYIPGLVRQQLGRVASQGHLTGKWIRRGNRIILFGV
ncbi:MAG: hypothetical protein M5R41_05175 [Bacteroidia bacterium]|nr:hypothetical protein [Bacteroidia bacterium]